MVKSTHRLSAASAVFAFVTAIAGFALPARADQAGFSADRSAYLKAKSAFSDRVTHVESLLSSPSSLKNWTDIVNQLGTTVNAAASTMNDRIISEWAQRQGCTAAQTALYGPYDSKFGFDALATDYHAAYTDLYNARHQLIVSQNSLVDKVGLAVAQHKPIDALLNDQLAATRSALSRTDALYSAMIDRSNSFANEAARFKNQVAGPVCDPRLATPTPKPTATPTPLAPNPFSGTFVDSNKFYTLTLTGASPVFGTMRWFSPSAYGGADGTQTLSSCFALKGQAVQCESAGEWHSKDGTSVKYSGPATLELVGGSNGFYLQWQMTIAKTAPANAGKSWQQFLTSGQATSALLHKQ
jgi:hypothetical protein